MNKKTIIASVIVLLVLVATTLVYKNAQESSQNQAARESASELVRPYSPMKGSKDAKVTIVEFLDPACETCRQFYPFVKNILKSKPGKVNLVVRHAPFHQGSDVMVLILEAAKEQGKYWQTLEVMLKEQANWTEHHRAQPEKIWKYLAPLGLDLDKLREDMKKPEIVQRVQQDIADTMGLKVTKTPGFFVNGQPLTKFGYQTLKDLIESEISKNY